MRSSTFRRSVPSSSRNSSSVRWLNDGGGMGGWGNRIGGGGGGGGVINPYGGIMNGLKGNVLPPNGICKFGGAGWLNKLANGLLSVVVKAKKKIKNKNVSDYYHATWLYWLIQMKTRKQWCLISYSGCCYYLVAHCRRLDYYRPVGRAAHFAQSVCAEYSNGMSDKFVDVETMNVNKRYERCDHMAISLRCWPCPLCDENDKKTTNNINKQKPNSGHRIWESSKNTHLQIMHMLSESDNSSGVASGYNVFMFLIARLDKITSFKAFLKFLQISKNTND